MRRALITFFLLLCFGLLPCFQYVEAALFPWGSSTLLKIDQQEYSAEDFKHWWRNWQETNQPLPETIDPYIDWILMGREAERMLLFDDPAYHRDINIYLKVLSQVQLKNDEIDSKVNITDEMIREQYREQYTPVWHYNFAVVKEKSTAETLHAALVAGEVSMEDLARAVQAGNRVPHGHPAPAGGVTPADGIMQQFPGLEEQLLGVQLQVKRRPVSGDQDQDELLRSLEPGTFSKPSAWQDAYVIVQLIDRVEGNEEDFAKSKVTISSKIRKVEQGRLTVELIDRLKEKFGVVVNEARLLAIDPDAPDPQHADDILITIGELTISEGQVLEKVNTDLQTNLMYGLEKGDSKASLYKVVNGIIGQTLITLESLDRHYERKSPIKELMEFKQKHKLVQKLEQQIRNQVGEVSDDEVTAYYNSHKEDLAGPEVYKMILVKGAEEDLNKIWMDVVVNGMDFKGAAEKWLGERPVVQSFPVSHLDDEVVKNARGINNGEISRVFPVQDTFAIINLVDYVQSITAPIENVREGIRKKLSTERYDAAREKYVKDLREKASIEISDKTWTKIKAELLQAK